MDTRRVFIAAVPPEQIIQSLSRTVSNYKKENWGKDVRWVKTENLHLTLKFIGDVTNHQLADIVSAIEDISQNAHSFTAEISGLFLLPSASRPKVISAGIQENAHLLTLAEQIEYTLSGIGFPKEKRKFKGHITLGRCKRSFPNRQKVNDRIITGSFPINEIFIFQSILRPTGPEYKIDHKVSLR